MTISNLIARLEAASGPDRELDAAIALQAGWQVFPGDNWIGPEGKIAVPELTASIDAAAALAERVLPGWRNSSIKTNENEYAGYVWQRDDTFLAEGIRSSRSIALLIATLKAKEDTHGK